MARTRIWEATAEFADTSSSANFYHDWDSTDFISGAQRNATARTGQYSWYLTYTHNYAKNFASLTQFQAACPVCLKQQVTQTSDFLRLYCGANMLCRVEAQADRTCKVYILGSLVPSTVPSGWDNALQWRLWGFDVKIGNPGWVKVYLDGVEVASVVGDTTAYGAMTRLMYANLTLYGNDGYYIDDVWLDDTTGEANPAAPADHRFYRLDANGNGDFSDFTGQDGNKVDNYLNVDENPADGDTTYNESQTLDEKDCYHLTTVAIPANWVVYGVRAAHVARRTDASVATAVKCFLRLNGVSAEDAGDQVLPTNYSDALVKGALQLTKPGGGAWTQADIDALQSGLIARGPF